MPDTHTHVSIPEFIDSFNPDLARRAVLAQLTTLNAALSAARRIDSDLPMSGELIRSLEGLVSTHNLYLTDILPHMLAYRAKLRDLASIDPRLSVTPNKTSLHSVLFTSLNADETYQTFKFIAGKICKQGWKLVEGKADHVFGSVDFKFTCLDGRGSLMLYVKPGASATCQLHEQTEMREVIVKKIICDGIETGEMSEAKLTSPSAPAVEPPPSSLTNNPQF